MIVLVNVALKAILRCISKFEKAHTKTEELQSTTLKMFIVQFINTAVLILLINANFAISGLPENFPLMNGDFNDFSI